MKTLIVAVLMLFSSLTLANGYCESRPGQKAVMNCYESLVMMESNRLGRLYKEFGSHPNSTQDSVQQMDYDHQNWSGMLEASCQDYRCMYIALVNRNNALTSRLKALGPVQAAAPVPQPSHNGPSFNCAKASTKVEHLICNNATVSGLDVDLSESYKEALAMTTDNNWMKEEQVEWVKTSRNVCSDEACLIKAYEQRIDELFWMKKHMEMEQ